MEATPQLGTIPKRRSIARVHANQIAVEYGRQPITADSAPGPANVQEQRKVRAASGSATGTPPPPSKPNVFPPRIGEGPSPTKQIPPRGGQSLADWYRKLSLNEIRRCIVAGMLSSKEFLREVLEPECINVMAEKMADANTHDSAKCYLDDYGRIPKPIREAVSQVIAADDDLQNGVRENMKNTGNFLMCTMGWFAVIAQYYPADFLEGLNLDLEHVRDTAEFRASLDIFCPEFARGFVVLLLMHGHVQAALVLIDIFWKHDSAFWSSVLKTQREQTAVQLFCRSDKMQEVLTQQQVRQLQRFFGAKKCADPLDSVFS